MPGKEGPQERVRPGRRGEADGLADMQLSREPQSGHQPRPAPRDGRQSTAQPPRGPGRPHPNVENRSVADEYHRPAIDNGVDAAGERQFGAEPFALSCVRIFMAPLSRH